MARYGKKAGGYVEQQMHEYEHGEGRAESPQQAIAIGLSKARKAGVKVPPPPKKRTTAKK